MDDDTKRAGGRHAGGVSVTLSALQRVGGMSAGQVVTTLVGLGLCLGELHTNRRFGGPVHPRHVEIDEDGRPRLRAAEVPENWCTRDDVLALLRLGVALAAGEGELALSLRDRARSTELELELGAVVCWLLTLATPEPLVAAS